MQVRLKIMLIATGLFLTSLLRADEGMWVPLLLEKLNQSEMQRMGLRITAEEVFSINNASMKDAIVRFGGGCTAEIVSEQGLILTNHHCGYRQIQTHSSIEHDYLTRGFWAMNQKEELPNPGLKATILIRMEDVTEQILKGISAGMNEEQRSRIIEKNIKKVSTDAVKGTHYKAEIKAFYHGNQYFMFINEEFSDVRLVGAPPSNIGKFGGDTDNWMWPRHTGDFSIFRIYAGKDNKPADYSPDNVPYKPRYTLSISLKGYQKGDFTFVYGYPGSTDQYLSSFAVENLVQTENPAGISLRQKRLDIMNEFMNASDMVRIQYSAKYAGVANYWKKMIGESRGIKRLDAIAKKQAFERNFAVWAENNEHKNLIPALQSTFREMEPLAKSFRYFIEASHAIEINRLAFGYFDLANKSKDESITDEKIIQMAQDRLKGLDGFYKDYHAPLDCKVMASLLKMYYDNNKGKLPDIFTFIETKFKGDFNAYAVWVFDNSVFASREKLSRFLQKYKRSHVKKLEKDPAYVLAKSTYGFYFDNIQKQLAALEYQADSLQRVFMKAQMLMQPEKRFYPDANSTLRIAYGNVKDYEPRDAVRYHYFTTLDGILEKEDPAIYDYVVENKLKSLYQSQDYGTYADKDGKMHVAFIASNHTTGGNSGSPVFNADGHLIGINFDRNWEGTMSDIMYDPDQCRNISLDIRYCLFIIDKFAGAGHLVKEMKIVN